VDAGGNRGQGEVGVKEQGVQWANVCCIWDEIETMKLKS
jgi:hypothetical protein